MNRYAEIKNGLVVNIAIMSEVEAQKRGSEWIPTLDAGRGWSYNDGIFTPPPKTPDELVREEADKQREVVKRNIRYRLQELPDSYVITMKELRDLGLV